MGGGFYFLGLAVTGLSRTIVKLESRKYIVRQEWALLAHIVSAEPMLPMRLMSLQVGICTRCMGAWRIQATLASDY